VSITLVVILCHQLVGVTEPICVEEAVPQMANREAGLVASPLPMAQMEMFECRVTALPAVAQWLAATPAYKGWTVERFDCVRDYVPKGRA
jgi:hypothetical protein